MYFVLQDHLYNVFFVIFDAKEGGGGIKTVFILKKKNIK